MKLTSINRTRQPQHLRQQPPPKTPCSGAKDNLPSRLSAFRARSERRARKSLQLASTRLRSRRSSLTQRRRSRKAKFHFCPRCCSRILEAQPPPLLPDPESLHGGRLQHQQPQQPKDQTLVWESAQLQLPLQQDDQILFTSDQPPPRPQQLHLQPNPQPNILNCGTSGGGRRTVVKQRRNPSTGSTYTPHRAR